MASVSASRGAHDAQLFINDREKLPRFSNYPPGSREAVLGGPFLRQMGEKLRPPKDQKG